MKVNAGKTIRFGDLSGHSDKHFLWVDTSVASSIGAVKGLENYRDVIGAINSDCDAIVLNPGQLEHNADLLGGSHRASPIVRLDWTNYLRDKDFCLPAQKIQRVMISSVEDALVIGASAVVVRYTMGLDDDFEAENIESISLTAKDAYRESLPIIVELCPVGYKVNDRNFDGTVELGVACMLEAGADALVLPQCKSETVKEIADWSEIPVILYHKDIPDKENIDKELQTGVCGILISENLFGFDDYVALLRQFSDLMHSIKQN